MHWSYIRNSHGCINIFRAKVLDTTLVAKVYVIFNVKKSVVQDNIEDNDNLVQLKMDIVVKPKSEVPKSKVPKSRPKGLGMTQ